MYAIQVKDKWTGWRISRTLDRVLLVFATRKHAQELMDKWKKDETPATAQAIRWARHGSLQRVAQGGQAPVHLRQVHGSIAEDQARARLTPEEVSAERMYFHIVPQ